MKKGYYFTMTTIPTHLFIICFDEEPTLLLHISSLPTSSQLAQLNPFLPSLSSFSSSNMPYINPCLAQFLIT
jgi:hypothetical protein